jgi:hypothetical protein
MYINTIEELDWWNTLDMRCAILNHRWSMMFGVEQRISQLYIIREIIKNF